MWDVWFGSQIVCYTIEHPSIINKIGFFKRSSVVLKFEFPCKIDNEDSFVRVSIAQKLSLDKLSPLFKIVLY